MEMQTDLSGWLNRFPCPGFAVKENSITHCNQAAVALLLNPGTDVRELLLTGEDEYAAFQEGCLYLKLKLSSRGWGASVTRENGFDIFLLDQQPEDADLRSLALAARELRNPLSSMLIAADGLSHSLGEDPAVQELLARLNRGMSQMYRLVNNMSDAAKSDILSPVGMHDWDRLVRDIFEKIQTQLPAMDVTLTYEGLGQPLYGLANEGQLERAILNIVSNALKFTPKGGSIHAKLTRKSNMLHLSIQDSGSGIDEAVLPNVFSRYQRQPGIEDSRHGLGLGMVLIRSAASDHGGTVLIDCPKGKGTRITMTLAIRQDASMLKTPVMAPIVASSNQVLTELSDVLPWECYQK